jgi:IS5 family transposase
MDIGTRVYHQKQKDKNKLYSVHAPEVKFISKGKAHKRYEFDCKVSVAETSKTNNPKTKICVCRNELAWP